MNKDVLTQPHNILIDKMYFIGHNNDLYLHNYEE